MQTIKSVRSQNQEEEQCRPGLAPVTTVTMVTSHSLLAVVLMLAACGRVSTERQKKLFFVSTSSTTSTLSTTTLCWKAGTTTVACTSGRKRRALESRPAEDESYRLKPSRWRNITLKDSQK